MKQNLLLAFVFLVTIQVFSQDKNWSVETNYAIIPSDGFGGKDNVIDAGIKYRFVDFEFLNLGFGFNGGFSTEKFEVPTYTGRTNLYYFQPRLFSEFNIPKIIKLRPTISLGYSIINSRFNYTATALAVNPIDVLAPDFTDGGFNFNLGLTYDIGKRYFVQVQYDFVGLKKQENSNNIRIGLGFRF